MPVFSQGAAHYRPDTCDALAAAAEAGAVRIKAAVHGNYPGIEMPGALLPELRTAGYWDVPTEQPWGLDWHRNEGVEFTYLSSGHLGFAVDDSTFALQPGHLTVTRPWQSHRVGLPNVGASRLGWVILDVGVRRPNQTWLWPKWILLSTEEKKQLSALLRHNEQPVWKAGEAIAMAFKKINRAAESAAGTFDRTGMVLAINELLLSILRSLAGQNITEDGSLTSSKRAVELFLAQLPEKVGEPWTVDLMAERCGLKRSRFTSYCQELTNCTPLEHLLNCRVEAAARILRGQPKKPLLDVAMECGFSSSQHFSTAFRRVKGCAPSDLRRASV